MVVGRMQALYAIGAALICILSRRTAAHPLCYYDDRPTDPDMVMIFCPPQEEGACCNEAEEMAAITLYNEASATTLTDECAELYRQVACGPCNAYSGHLYERLGSELGPEDGMTMKSSFCEELVDTCEGQIDFKSYDGDSYCEKHVDDDNLWSYPIDPEELDFTSTGLVDAFPDLPEGDIPSNLICMHMTPDGDEWWLGGQDGQIMKVDADDATSSSLVVDMSTGLDLHKAYEEGLIDFAFSPAFNDNSYFYVSYTIADDEGTKNRLARLTYSSSSPTTTKTSIDILITTIAKATSIHSAGWVGFKPSDYENSDDDYHDIYWSIGDGGPQEDLLSVGPDLDNLLATIVRVSVPSGTSSSDTGYIIPDGNVVGGMPEICANGFRNPFRCGFDSATDDLYCADVGHILIEEINLIECGNDYGWSRFEGSRCFDMAADRYGDCDGASRSGYTFPVFEYCHQSYDSTEEGEEVYTDGIDICGSRSVIGNAVIAGHVYRGQRFSEVLGGALLFSEAQKGNIYYLVKDEEGVWVPGTIISDNSASVISWAEDKSGELFVITNERKPYTLPCGDLCSTTCLPQADVLPDFESLGCFADVVNNRALQLQKSPTCEEGEDNMSPAVCASYCETIPGAVYFGVEFAYECFCGGEGEDFDKHGELDMESCGTICTGTPDEFCGGYAAIEVYTFESGSEDDDLAPAPVPPTPLPPTPLTPPISTPTPGSGAGYSYVGCFGDVYSPRVLSGASTLSSSMTAQICSSFCEGSQYFATQYGTECFCSASGDDYDALGTATCNYECGGDASETCGGFYAMSVYEYDDAADDDVGDGVDDGDYTYVGCYFDTKTSRVLSGSSTSSSSMTTNACYTFCEGSAYFGTEYGIECFCGSPSSLDTTASNCDFDCAGDSSDTCGGYNAISLYSYGDVPAPTPVVEDDDAGDDDYTYVGCYFDTNTARVLGGMSTSSSSMTTDACFTFCEGSAYFGTEYGIQCFCGSPSSLGTTASNCDFDCAGDSSETCGGYDAISIYSYGDVPAPTPVVDDDDAGDDDYTYVGCYFDSKGNRLLTSSSTASSSMTTESCSVFCEGSNTYFGTEHGDECFCGSPSSLGSTASNCDFDCAGDSSETCGGYDAISIYTYGGGSSSTGTYVGCYTDSASNRVMTSMTMSDSMTNELCASNCDGFAYYGTQYSTQCFCSDSDSFAAIGTSTACTMSCAGDSSSTCGGYDALSVYEK